MAAGVVGVVQLTGRVAQHLDPVWRERSNFIIGARLERSSKKVKIEQLWAQRQPDDRFIVCCIPFYIYEVALGDLVTLDGEMMVNQVVQQSGRYVFRAYFRDTQEALPGVRDELMELGALCETLGDQYLAIDAADKAHAQELADFLWRREEAGLLFYETGRRTAES